MERRREARAGFAALVVGAEMAGWCRKAFEPALLAWTRSGASWFGHLLLSHGERSSSYCCRPRHASKPSNTLLFQIELCCMLAKS
jgi:hypothetical protein